MCGLAASTRASLCSMRPHIFRWLNSRDSTKTRSPLLRGSPVPQRHARWSAQVVMVLSLCGATQKGWNWIRFPNHVRYVTLRPQRQPVRMMLSRARVASRRGLGVVVASSGIHLPVPLLAPARGHPVVAHPSPPWNKASHAATRVLPHLLQVLLHLPNEIHWRFLRPRAVVSHGAHATKVGLEVKPWKNVVKQAQSTFQSLLPFSRPFPVRFP
mmetsp:Transcript_40960/g.103194  ORF Transcript_40960/g.103194 Transcript_40960/m.103194 type:complete len:213 (-) Transcript_40960:156-794(-)